MALHDIHLRLLCVSNIYNNVACELLKSLSEEAVAKSNLMKDVHQNAISVILQKNQHILKNVKALNTDSNKNKIYDSNGVIKSSPDICNFDTPFICELLFKITDYPTYKDDRSEQCGNNVSCLRSCCQSCDHTCSTCGQSKCSKGCISRKQCTTATCLVSYADCLSSKSICCSQCNLCGFCNARQAPNSRCNIFKLKSSLTTIRKVRHTCAHGRENEFEDFANQITPLHYFEGYKDWSQLQNMLKRTLNNVLLYLERKSHFPSSKAYIGNDTKKKFEADFQIAMHSDKAKVMSHFEEFLKNSEILNKLECLQTSVSTVEGAVADLTEYVSKIAKYLTQKNLEGLNEMQEDVTDILKGLKTSLDRRFATSVTYINNRDSPIPTKLKVLATCITPTLLSNCELVGYELPKGMERLYFSLIKSALNVRFNTPNEIVLIESGLLPLKALILERQLEFYRTFKENMGDNSTAQSIFNEMLCPDNRAQNINHYTTLDQKYANPKDIPKEALEELKSKIRKKSLPDKHYRYYIYHQINPELLPSPFLKHPNAESITRFRLGSHNLPIETGRYDRILRENRLCPRCQVLGDEHHFLFRCTETERNSSHKLTEDLSEIWKHDKIGELFNELEKSEYLKVY